MSEKVPKGWKREKLGKVGKIFGESTQLQITIKDLSELETNLPKSLKKINRFEDIVDDLFNKIQSNKNQIHTLKNFGIHCCQN